MTAQTDAQVLCDYSAAMATLTQNEVREFFLNRYADALRATGLNPAEIPDSFDFLLSGIIDSFGVMEMVTAVEQEFKVQIDLASLDAEHVTILGPLSRHIVENSKADLSSSSRDIQLGSLSGRKASSWPQKPTWQNQP